MAGTTALEARVDVEALDTLHAERRKLMQEYAPLEALFGGGVTRLFDAKRKAYRAVLEAKVVTEPEKYGLKPGARGEFTETGIERAANASPEYQAYLADHEKLMVRHLELRNAINEIDERIRNREIELRIYSAEAYLGR